MNQEDLKELIYLLAQKDIAEFSIEHPDATVRIKRRTTEGLSREAVPVLSTISAAQTAIAMEACAPAASAVDPVLNAPTPIERELHVLKSQMVGVFHRAETPDRRPFLNEGDTVNVGQVVGIVEVLRLRHEVTSDVAGHVMEIMIGDRQPVEYGQPLLTVRLQN